MTKYDIMACPKCYDVRSWCENRRDGKCTILKDTYPATKLCPFYKKLKELKK